MSGMQRATQLFLPALRLVSAIGLLISMPLVSAHADRVARPADWPMYMYNAQHTGYNDSSTLRPPLTLSWWRRVFDTAQYLNELAIANDYVLVTHNDEHMYDLYGKPSVVACLSATTGRVMWSCDYGTSIRVYPPAAAYGRAYIQVGDGPNSYMTALDLSSGQLLWKTYYIEQFENRLAPTIWSGRVLCGSGYDGGMECFDAQDGQAFWQRSTIAYEDWTPAVHNGKAYTFLNGYLTVYNVTDGSVDWALNIVSTSASTNYPCDGYLMGVAPVLDTVRQIAYLMWHEYFTAVDLQTRSILWKDWGNFGCGINPAICDGQVFAIDSGIFKCLDGMTGEEIWRYQEDLPFEYPPVVANGYVYVGGVGRTLAFDLSSHQEVWRCTYAGYLAIAGNMLYIAGQNGWLNAFEQTDPTDVKSIDTLPHGFALRPNFPNPFNPSTTIFFAIPKRADVKLVVYDILGRAVRRLVHGVLASGEHTVTWDGTDDAGSAAASGIYLYRLESGSFSASRKMVLLR
jgi:outer membrane protein assembly factor BamB